MAAPKAKRKQISRPTKRQIGFQIAGNIITQLTGLADGIRNILTKGQAINVRTQQAAPMGCSPADVKSAFSPEQLAAVEEFVSVFGSDTEPEKRPPGA